MSTLTNSQRPVSCWTENKSLAGGALRDGTVHPTKRRWAARARRVKRARTGAKAPQQSIRRLPFPLASFTARVVYSPPGHGLAGLRLKLKCKRKLHVALAGCPRVGPTTFQKAPSHTNTWRLEARGGDPEHERHIYGPGALRRVRGAAAVRGHGRHEQRRGQRAGRRGAAVAVGRLGPGHGL